MHGSNARNLSVKLSFSQTCKNAMSSYYRLCFLLNKTGQQEGGIGSTQKQRSSGGGKVAQTMYTHVSKGKTKEIGSRS
jgi:hypothetical protein